MRTWKESSSSRRSSAPTARCGTCSAAQRESAPRSGRARGRAALEVPARAHRRAARRRLPQRRRDVLAALRPGRAAVIPCAAARWRSGSTRGSRRRPRSRRGSTSIPPSSSGKRPASSAPPGSSSAAPSRSKGPGSFFTARVADEEILVARGGGTLRALSNVCRHRAGPVAAGAGSCRAFTCGYHGWSYGLDGRLLGTPEFDGAEDFHREDVRLPAFRADTWIGLVFAHLDPAAPALVATLEALAPRLESRGLASMVSPSAATGRSNATGRCTSTTISRGTTSPSSIRAS